MRPRLPLDAAREGNPPSTPLAMSRRAFIKAAALAGGLALQHAVIAPFLWAGDRLAPETKPLSPNNAGPDGVFGQAAELTGRYLEDIEKRLRARLEQEDPPFSETARMWAIQMAMTPLLSGMSSDFLQMMGDSQSARKRLSFLMPLVRWMSEPFLFPVEKQGAPEELARETGKIFDLMARLRNRGLTTTLDNVGDASLSPEDATAYRKYYETLLCAFRDSKGAEELNMSLKLSAWVHGLDAALGSGTQAEGKRREIVDSLAHLLNMASQTPDRNIFLRIDMEEYAYKDLTLKLFREVVETNPSAAADASGNLRIGVVIQTYLRDAAPDVRDLADWARANRLRVPVRLVKGAYLDFEREQAAEKGYPSPVWDNKPSTDANFEAVSAYALLNLDAVIPAFATHNIRSQAHAMALAQAYGLPPDAAPIQMLYGMGDPIKHVVASMNRPLREYIPAGSLARGLKYAGRRFAELAGSDNALAKTMRGDFSEVADETPVFTGEQDKKDSKIVKAILEQALKNRQPG